jgi:hypothetical protein
MNDGHSMDAPKVHRENVPAMITHRLLDAPSEVLCIPGGLIHRLRRVRLVTVGVATDQGASTPMIAACRQAGAVSRLSGAASCITQYSRLQLDDESCAVEGAGADIVGEELLPPTPRSR